MEPVQRASALAALIGEVTRDFTPMRSAASVIDHAVGGAEPRLVVVDRSSLDRRDGRVSGDIVVLTDELVAFVRLDGCAPAESQLAPNDAPITVEVLPRSALTSLTAACPGIRRNDYGSTEDFATFPTGTELRARYRGRDERLVITADDTRASLAEVHAALVQDLARAHP